VDSASNSLIVRGPQEDLLAITALVTRLEDVANQPKEAGPPKAGAGSK
jgi:hypothetical protein